MSRFRKLTQTIRHCQYHIVWAPKYRYRVLDGKIASEVGNCIRAFSEQKECEIVELNVQIDHVHLLVMVPPKICKISATERETVRIERPVRQLKTWGQLPLPPQGARQTYPFQG